jgi:hypothetical protein
VWAVVYPVVSRVACLHAYILFLHISCEPFNLQVVLIRVATQSPYSSLFIPDFLSAPMVCMADIPRDHAHALDSLKFFGRTFFPRPHSSQSPLVEMLSVQNAYFYHD